MFRLPHRRRSAAGHQPEETPTAGRGAAQSGVPRKRRRRRAVVALLVGGLLGAGAGGVALQGRRAYQQLESNITSEPIAERLGPSRPPRTPVAVGTTRALNIVLIGSDTRAGGNVEYGGPIRGARSDVALLLHLSADRKRAVAVGLPRDAMLPIPPCVGADGETRAASFTMFNDAYARGGSACTVRTIEANTGVRVDHHVVVDFAGLKDVVDALGGVQVCSPRPVYDRYSKLSLPAGVSQVDGEMALAYVRARDFDGGSDLRRMERQQRFLAAMVQKVTSAGILANPVKLYGFLDAATRAVTTDPELARLGELVRLAQSLQSIGLDRIHFMTVPVQGFRPNPHRVQWSPRAADLWRLLRRDLPVPERRFETRSAGQSICS